MKLIIKTLVLQSAVDKGAVTQLVDQVVHISKG